MNQRAHQKLIVWQEAYQLTLQTYRMTKLFPAEEKYGLVSQMRRAAYSIPFNIAEGNEKRSKKERLHFFEIAKASLEELHCQCQLSMDLSYLSNAQFSKLDAAIQQVSYLLIQIRKSLKNSFPPSSHSLHSSYSS